MVSSLSFCLNTWGHKEQQQFIFKWIRLRYSLLCSSHVQIYWLTHSHLLYIASSYAACDYTARDHVSLPLVIVKSCLSAMSVNVAPFVPDGLESGVEVKDVRWPGGSAAVRAIWSPNWQVPEAWLLLEVGIEASGFTLLSLLLRISKSTVGSTTKKYSF